MSFLEDATFVEEDNFTRVDLTPYRELFDKLRNGQTATLTVDTGEIYTEGPHKGKGKDAMKHVRGFQTVATERGVGLRVGHTNMPGGKTRLRLRTGPKREFSAETVAKRNVALAKAAETRKVKAYMVEHPDATEEVARKAIKEAAAKANAPTSAPVKPKA